MKNKKLKTPNWHSLANGLRTGAALAFLVATKAASAQTKAQMPVTSQRESAVRMRDSLDKTSTHIFNIAQEKYFDRIDKKYTVGCFFNSDEIAKINKTLAPYLTKMAGDSGIAYKYAKQNMPIRTDLPFNVFLDVVYILDVPAMDLAPFGMVFDNTYFNGFTDKKRGALFEEFLDESYAGFLDDDDVPNYSIPEFAKIRTEYDIMLHKIDSLNDVIYRADSLSAIRNLEQTYRGMLR